MANTLMFEVGIKSAQEQLDKIKQEFVKANGDLTKLLNLKVSIEGVDAITRALNQIGDTTALRNLRNEITALNREFSILSKGAGGSGDIASRGIAADIERATQSIERYTNKIKQLTDERTRLVGGTRNSNYQNLTDEILRYESSLEGARRKLAQLNEQKNQPVTGDSLKKATLDAQTFETAVGRIETAIGGLKSGMNISLSGDFSKWAQEVQAVTTSVRELVEQLQKMNTATPAQAATEATKAQTQAVLEESDAYKQLAKWREQAEKYFASNSRITDNNTLVGHAVNGIVLGDKGSLETLKQHIYLQKDENKLLAERKLLVEQISKSNIRKFEQRTNYQDVLGVYDNVLGSLQKLKQEESKPAPQGGLFDAQQFNTLREAIDQVIKEINRLKEAFAGIGEFKGVTQLTEAINTLYHNVSTFKDVFATLSAAVNLTPTSEYVRKLQTDFDAAQAKVQELTEKLTALAAAQNNVAESASKAGKSEKQIGDSQTAMLNRYQKLLADIQNIEREIEKLQSGAAGGQFGSALSDYHTKLSLIKEDVKTITSSGSPAEALTKGMSSEMLAKLTSALSQLKTEYKSIVSESKAFNKATDKDSAQAEARIRKLGIAFNELKNYMKANGGSEEMKRLQIEIQGAIRKMRDLMNAGKYGEAINVYERLSSIIRQAASATKDFERAQHSVSSTVSHTNTQLLGQSQILSDLKSMAMQYLSVWGATNFIHNIIELGGQLEQQRLSIGAILQDTAQANHLFSQIKDLAIKSPFGVQQLDQMSKQLTAYGFQYSELYDWTKRLADISAATGTSVDRLALALGHVRSEGALSGYTLRQFSMGNIPLLQKLSENLGKTKQEIRKMTRNKEIGYEDVLDVLRQLTDESGMFYNAQEVMSEALNAKFKNLRDSFQIMYSEMAEGAPGDFLKGFATTMTELSRQWQILLPMIGAAGAMWAMNRASAVLVNVELAKMASLTNANTLASSKYSVAQLRQIANWEKMPHAMVRARLALQGFKTALLSLGRIVFSWPTAIFAAIEALTYMWAKQSRESEKAKEMTEVLSNTAIESQKNLGKQLSNIGPYQEGMSDSEMKTGIDSMTEAIKNYGVNAQEVLETVYGKDAEGRVMSLADRYEYLREELAKTNDVYKEMQRTTGGIEFGVEFSDGGWLDDDVQTDLTNYAEAVKEYEKAFITMTANYSNAVNKALEVAKKASPAFSIVAEKLASDAERIKFLYEHQDFYGNEYNIFKSALHEEDPNAGGGVLGYALGENLRKAEQEAMKELDQFLKGTEEWFKKYGYDFSENGKNLSETQVGNLLKQSKEWLEKHPEWENIYSVIWDKLNKRWGIPIVPDVTGVEEELPQWMVDFQKELDKTGIKLTATMSMEQIVDEMKKAYDKAQTTINKLGPIAMQAKIDIKGLTDENIEQYKFLNPELYETLKDLKKAQESKNQVETAGKKRGLNFKGMKKDGTHKKEKQNTEAAKAVREQVRVIKAAADAFQYWREKVGDKGAWEHVQSEFGDVLAKIGITAQNIEDVRGHLKRIPEMKEYKAITDKKVKTEIKKEIAKDEDQFIRKDFERDTERFLSRTQIELDNLTRAWETFNAVREATNDIQLAANLSGAEYAAGQTSNLAAALKEKIQNDLYSIKDGLTIDFNINLSDEQVQREVERVFEEAKPVQEKGESKEDYNKRLTEYQSRIKGVVNEIKKWRDLQRQMRDDSIKAYVSMVADTDSLKTKVAKVNDEYQKQIEYLNTLRQLGKLTDEQYKNGIEKVGRTRKLGQAEALVDSTDWGRSFGVVGSVLKGAARELGSELKKIITSSDFRKLDAAEQTKYLELQSKLHQGGQTVTSPFNLGAWGDMQNLSRDFQKNVKSLIESMKDLDYWTREEADAEKAFNSASSPSERAAALTRLTVARQNKNNAQVKVKEYESNVKETGEQLQQAGEYASNGLNDFSQALSQVTNGSLSGLVLGIGNIIKVLKGDGDQAKSVGALFGEAGKNIGGIIEAVLSIIDMLGEEPVKFFDDLLSKVSRVIEAVISNIPNILGSILKGAGNIVASTVDGIGGLFGIDFGLSDLFNPDGKLQEEIDALKANVTALEANTEVIKAMRKRTLGYDTGNIRSSLIGQYTKDDVNFGNLFGLAMDFVVNMKYGPAGTAMADFYARNGNGTGYSQEYENLKNMRQDYIDMYNLEQDKKDASDEALNEYKQKIAELDEQILYFVEDLANELYGIDLKTWADQISDSLWTAFENGEDALEAFHETAKDIISDVAKRMMNIKLIEPLFADLEEALFGHINENGQRVGGEAYNYETGKFNEEKTLEILGQFFGDNGKMATAIEAAEEFYDMAQKATGFDFGSTSGGSASSSIKGITEQTADLLASYLNSVRADVSVNREMVAQYFPMFYAAMTSGNANLRNIENHTDAIMRSNDIIAEKITRLDEDVHGLRTNVWRMPLA